MESSLASGFGAGNWVQAGPVGAGPGSAAAPAPSREPCQALCHGAPSHGDQAPFLAETAASFIFFWWCHAAGAIPTPEQPMAGSRLGVARGWHWGQPREQEWPWPCGWGCWAEISAAGAGREAVAVSAWLAMNFVCLATFSQLCCGQKDKSSRSFFFFFFSQGDLAETIDASCCRAWM